MTKEPGSASNPMGGIKMVVSSAMACRGIGARLQSINLFSEPGTAPGDNRGGAPRDRREAVKSCQVAAENEARPSLILSEAGSS